MNALFFYYSKLLRTIRRHFFLVKIGAGKIRPTVEFCHKSREREEPEMALSIEKRKVMDQGTRKERIYRLQAGGLR
jgi:hypothetical protein